MPTGSRIKQIFAILIAIFFVAGFFYSPIGVWTGPILGLWLVGTQKPWAGFVWLMSFAFIPSLLDDKSPLWHSSSTGQIPEGILWVFVASLIAILPLIFHRLISPRLNGLLSTLPYPFAAAFIQPLAKLILPESGLNYLLHHSSGSGFTIFANEKVMNYLPLTSHIVILAFLHAWIVAGIIWMWNLDFAPKKIQKGIFLFSAVFAFFLAEYYRAFEWYVWDKWHVPVGLIVMVFLVVGIIFLTLYAVFRPAYRIISWADKAESIALLESPTTHTPLHFHREGQREFLVSASGERFPILNEIPQFVAPESISGANKKYNHLYQIIGGFYDDTQRVVAALSGISVDDHFLNYLCNLEIKPGDKVLETSVGTGLNLKYLPRGVELCGLDLSSEMLSNCQTNLRRWNLNCDLVLGNAEELPYADESFDCVFHSGGINFFTDRAKAIREMIRVAKPGTRILIADETEKHVRTAYENIPVTGSYFKGRDEAVLAPVDLVPPEMLEIKLDTSLQHGHFYVLTFRKPPAVGPTASGSTSRESL